MDVSHEITQFLRFRYTDAYHNPTSTFTTACISPIDYIMKMINHQNCTLINATKLWGCCYLSEILLSNSLLDKNYHQIAKFMGPSWGPPGSCRPHVGPMLVPWTLLLGSCYKSLLLYIDRQGTNEAVLDQRCQCWRTWLWCSDSKRTAR